MTHTSRVQELMRLLDLQPHPEGGFYREVFRSESEIQPPDGRGPRAALTTIYFLLPDGTRSRWHQVTSDEVWHLYEGGPLELLELSESGETLTRHRLAPAGPDSDGRPVCIIPARAWQAARPIEGHALVGCSVAPGFDFADFRMLSDCAEVSEVVRATWPDVAELI